MMYRVIAEVELALDAGDEEHATEIALNYMLNLKNVEDVDIMEVKEITWQTEK